MRRAFTLIEMLVVVGLVSLLITVAVPAFSGMLYSASQATAENALRAASTLARDSAYASLTGGDGVAVFTTDELGRTRIVAGEILGDIEDQDVQAGAGLSPDFPAGNSDSSTRGVVGPVAFAEAITLPEFFSVRGYAPPSSLVGGWYTESEAYDSQQAVDEGNWVGIEDNLYDLETQSSDGTPRQSFAIRYSATSGKIDTISAPMLVVDPRPSSLDRDTGDFPSNRSDVANAWMRVDWATNTSDWTRQVIGREGTDINGDGTLQQNTGQLANAGNAADSLLYYEIVGNRSHDTVLAGLVGRVALFDQRRLARGIEARGINAETGSIYQPWNDQDGISFDLQTAGDPRSLFEDGVDADEVRQRINAWIDGDTDRDMDFDQDDEPESRIFLISRYTGELTEADR